MAILSFKRLVRATSSKLMNKLGATPSSAQLACEAATLNGGAKCSSKRNSRVAGVKGRNTSSKLSKKDAAIPEALLIAARNNLPPVQFHHVHGQNAQLSKDRCVARRTQGFSQALVFSNRVILPNERVYIKVLDIVKGWSGTIRFGFTSVDPATLRFQVPKHACPDMTNEGHTWARALADEVVRRNSVIHFSYNTNGFIHYGINNQDCGIFYANANTSQNLWFIVDIYGLTAAVELIDPRTTTGGSALASGLIQQRFGSRRPALLTSRGNPRAPDDDEPFNASLARSTTFKSTNAVEDLIAQYNILARRERKKRKKATHHPTPILDPWVQENLLGVQSRAGLLLPGFGPALHYNSAQQNIYTPMPYARQQQRQQMPLQSQHQNHQASVAAPPQQHYQAVNQEPLRRLLVPQAANQSAVDASLKHQFDALKINAASEPQSAPTAFPVAASAVPTKRVSKQASKQAIIDGVGNSSSNKVSQQPLSDATNKLQSKSRQQQLSGKAATQKLKGDTNAAASQAQIRDCPICFERPINCVLYQCGHMCTCYECGVKQWRTQSRSCPVCRTVIKDVIKAYMA